jgi:tetratricopeptide (TPR) repeat protein
MWVLLQRRNLEAALEALDRYYHSRDEELLNLLALGTRAKIQLLQGDTAAAKRTLDKAQELIRPGVVAPYYLTFTLTSRALLDLTMLEEARSAGDRGVARAIARRAHRSVRAALACAAKVSWERTETYRLAGRLAWLRGRPERALRWWTRSLAEGERLGTRPEVARTYLEAGRRLTAEGRGRTLHGDDADTCLEKARALFVALGLDREVEQVVLAQRRAA